MLTVSQLAAMQEMKITELERASLIDINKVAINAALPIEQRLMDFISQIKNPYCFLCGDVPVKIRFSSSKKSLGELLGDYFIGLK